MSDIRQLCVDQILAADAGQMKVLEAVDPVLVATWFIVYLEKTDDCVMVFPKRPNLDLTPRSRFSALYGMNLDWDALDCLQPKFHETWPSVVLPRLAEEKIIEWDEDGILYLTTSFKDDLFEARHGYNPHEMPECPQSKARSALKALIDTMLRYGVRDVVTESVLSDLDGYAAFCCDNKANCQPLLRQRELVIQDAINRAQEYPLVRFLLWVDKTLDLGVNTPFSREVFVAEKKPEAPVSRDTALIRDIVCDWVLIVEALNLDNTYDGFCSNIYNLDVGLYDEIVAGADFEPMEVLQLLERHMASAATALEYFGVDIYDNRGLCTTAHERFEDER